MKAKLISIGNSRGIRLPKAVVEQCGLSEDIELEVKGNRLIVHSPKAVRRGWEAAFVRMSARGDDRLAEVTHKWHGYRLGRDGVEMVAERFGVYLVSLDPTVGSEISKTRLCLVVSPDEMNRNIRTAIIVPMTTAQKHYPTRIRCTFGGKRGEVVLDQIRIVDQSRLVKRLGSIAPRIADEVSRVLREMFAM